MHGPINVKSPNNSSKWQMGFNSAFRGLKLQPYVCHLHSAELTSIYQSHKTFTRQMPPSCSTKHIPDMRYSNNAYARRSHYFMCHAQTRTSSDLTRDWKVTHQTRHVQHSPGSYPLQRVPPEANIAPPHTKQFTHLCLVRDENVITAVFLTQYLDWWAKFSSFLNQHAFHERLIFPVILCGCRTDLSGVREEHRVRAL
jgi:hypothetical protein